MSEEIKLTQMQKAMEGGKKNASSIGISSAVILSWIATTFVGVPIPNEVMVAIAGLIGAIATNIQNGGNK